ncbi:MAG: DNA translocase FtsK 4TM domain-containing protein, partial [Candidatus Obscuribacterales bacterium]|nr:DNA translocase FtsK 4TM domain-containing protein [Steroidobacteraceae bacterium]
MSSTAEASQKQLRKSAPLGNAVTRSLREGALWVFGALALILFVALVTYDRNDPSFATTGEPGPVNNLIGPVGAQLAGLLVMLFGRPAFLFPVMLGVTGYLLFAGRKETERLSRMALVLRAAGFVTTLITSCGLAAMHFASASYSSSAGGVLGESVRAGFVAGLGFLGATLLLLALWLAGVSLFSGLSWLEVMDRVGRWSLNSFDWGRARIAQQRELRTGREHKEQRQEVVREQQERAAKRTPPKIEAVIPKVEKSERVERERQVPLFEKPSSNELPQLSMLDDPPPHTAGYSTEALEAMSRLVELKLRDFGIEAEVVEVHPGPVITRFELRLAAGVKVSSVSNLAKDLAR